MKKKIFILMLGFLLIAVNLYAAGGDVIEGDAETGSAASADTSASAETSSAQAETPPTSDTTTAPQSSSVSTLSAESGAADASLSSILRPIQIIPAGNSGAAITSIPIEVPPGRKGIAPNLPLNYSSNSRNGWLGVGWSLDMGAIQRNTKRGVNYSANDYVVTVNGSSSELVQRGDWGTNYYGAKIEGAFSKYYFNSSTSGWEVTTKDGTKYYYGTTSASRQDNANGVFKWCLDKVQDTNGNYMTISYWKDQGEIYLDRIDYTGNTAGLSPTNYVKFYLEQRTDTPTMYISHSPVKTAYRLKSIEVYGNSQLTRKYVLNYNSYSNTEHSVLDSIIQYGSDGISSLPQTTFTWSGSSNLSFTSQTNPITPGSLNNGTGIYFGDWNGDGLSDVMWYDSSSGNNWWFVNDGNMNFTTYSNPINPVSINGGTGIYFGDWNGDGITDVMWYRNSDGYNWWFVNDGNLSFTTYTNPIAPSAFNNGTGIYFGDWNGNGITDVMWYDSGSGNNWWFINDGALSFTSYSNQITPGSLNNGTGIYFGDWNNDGFSDIMWYDKPSGNNWWFTNNGSLSFTTYTNPIIPSSFNNGTGIYFGDWNGDAITDVMWYDNSSGYNWWFVNDGNMNFTTYSNPINPGSINGGTGIYFGDWNGDGITDVMWYRNSDGYNWWFVNDGNMNFTTYSNPINPVSINGGTSIYFGDWNGDGITDVMWYNRDYGYNNWFANDSVSPDLLSAVSNGLGGTTTITYQPSSSYNNTLLPFIVQTVSSITVNDGNGNSSTTNYTYSGGYYDYADREFRGFEYVKSTAPNGTTTETWFKQDDIFKGLPYEQITKDSSGNIYTRTYNTYQSTSPYTGVNFPYLSQKDDYVYDGTPTPKQARTEFWYDNYGNITRKYLYGDVSITGDERDEYTEYYLPGEVGDWLVLLPKTTYVRNNIGAIKAQKWFRYYSGTGNLWQEESWLEGGVNPVTTYEYDSYGNIWKITDPKNNPPTIITYERTAYTYPATIQNPLGHIVQKTYDYRFGKPLTETDPNNNMTTYAYDVFGRLTKVTNPNDIESTYGTVSYYYQNFGTVGSQRVLTVATEQSGTANYIWNESYFDGLGRTIKTRSEGPDSKVIAQRTLYNNMGQVSYASLPYFEGIETERWTYYEYDPIGRITKITNPDSTYVTKNYLKGRTTLEDANRHQKIEEKDVYGRLIKVEEYTGISPSFTLYAVTQYEYDVLGNLTKVTDNNSNQTNITYDTLSRKTSMNDPDMGYWIYQYDANGNLTNQKDAKNQTILFTYDALNRIRKKDYPTGTDVNYYYDETTSTNYKGRLTRVTDASGTEKFYYDKLGRITKTIKTVNSVNYTTETTYDALSRTTSIKYPDNEIVNYSYDTGSNLSQVTGYATYSNYNALGQAGTITYANGVSTTYQYYTTNNRLYSITTSKQTTGLQNMSYAYGNTGNITGITDYLDSTRNQSFTYDDLNRLTQAQSTSYGTLTYNYNQIGNMTYNSQVGSYTYPTNGIRPHAVTQAGTNTYVYDANGNMTKRAGKTIVYNYDNMPTSIAGSSTVTSVYDYSGQRVKKTVSSVTTVYIGKLYECTSGVCTKYVFGGSQRIASKKQGAVYYYHTDHLGSSSIITDASGSKAEEIYYYPYGGTRYNSGAVNVKHKFTGQEEDPETGLYYYGARYYDPALGRFISADTIVPEPFNPQSLNRYSYCSNNPVIYTDPSGHGWGVSEIVSAIIIAVVAWAVDESGGNVSIGGQVSADSSGHANYSSWNPNTGETYQVNPSSTVGSGSYTTSLSLELYAWGTCVGCSNTNSYDNYGYVEDDYGIYDNYGSYGRRDEDRGWYVGNSPVNFTSFFVRPWWPRIFPRLGTPKPPANWPKPPGWTEKWQWRYPEGTTDKSPQPRWFDPKGGEWRWHAPDKYHPKEHWDYNPWDQWNSPWRNVEPSVIPPVNPPGSSDFSDECYASGMCI